jgi:DNA polymerase elongation subunit (family B)
MSKRSFEESFGPQQALAAKIPNKPLDNTRGFKSTDTFLKEAATKWSHVKRPALDLSGRTSVEVQQLRTDHYPVYSCLHRDQNIFHGYDPEIANEKTIPHVHAIRTFGVTMEGNSVEVDVLGFFPYLYIEADKDYITPQHCIEVRDSLNSVLVKEQGAFSLHVPPLYGTNESDSVAARTTFSQHSISLRTAKRDSIKNHRIVLHVEVVFSFTATYYNALPQPFYKISVTMPKYIPMLRKEIAEGHRIKWKSPPVKYSNPEMPLGQTHRFNTYKSRYLDSMTYEDNIEFGQRWVYDRCLGGLGWIEARLALDRSNVLVDARLSRAQAIVYAHDKDVGCHNGLDESDWDRIAPLRVMYYDIECSTEHGFPLPTRDPCIVISNIFRYHNAPASEPSLATVVLMVGECPPDDNAILVHCRDDKELLECQRALINDLDPDIISGYNSDGFDTPYMMDRASQHRLAGFSDFSRDPNARATYRKRMMVSRAHGANEVTVVNCVGRVFFDLLKWFKINFKFRDYRLGAVSQEILEDTKADVAATQIGSIYNSGPKGKKQIVDYCIKDTALVYRLVAEKSVWEKEIQSCRVTTIQFDDVNGRLMSFKVISGFMGSYARDRKANKIRTYLIEDRRLYQAASKKREGKLANDALELEYDKSTTPTDTKLGALNLEDIDEPWDCDIESDSDESDSDSDDEDAEPENKAYRRARKAVPTPKPAQDKYGAASNIVVVPNRPQAGPGGRRAASSDFEKGELSRDAGYSGAYVFDPVRGFYADCFVITEDFNSLYPSIMRAYNYCSTTLIHPSQLHLFPIEMRSQSDFGAWFIKPEVCQSASSAYLQRLLVLRAKAREEMEATDSKTRRTQLDLLQTVLKLNANSVYGFYGATSSPLYTPEVAASVTARGVKMIGMVTQHVESEYCIEKQLNANYKVIYGDTDSVMIKIPRASLTPEAIVACPRVWNIVLEGLKNFARKNPYNATDPKVGMLPRDYEPIAEAINDTLTRDTDPVAYLTRIPHIVSLAPLLVGMFISKTATAIFENSIVKLGFEKVYENYLLLAKKRYAGLYRTRPHTYDKVDVKGLEVKRRDPCKFFVNTFKKGLDKLIIEGDAIGALRYIQQRREDLHAGKINMSELINSRQYNKRAAQYASKQAHAELAERNMKDTSLPQYKLGDRVAFVVVQKKSKKDKLYEHVDNPLTVAAKRIPIDLDFYAGEKFLKPVGRMFAPIINKPTNTLKTEDSISGRLVMKGTTTIDLKLTRKADIQKVADALAKYGSGKMIEKKIHVESAPKDGSKTSQITSFFTTRLPKCLACGSPSTAVDSHLCRACFSNNQQSQTLVEFMQKLRFEDNTLETAIEKSKKKCFDCAQERAISCTTATCPERYDRFTRDHRREELQDIKSKLFQSGLDW